MKSLNSRIVAIVLTAFVVITTGGLVWQQFHRSKDLEITLWEEEQPAIQAALDEVIARFEHENPGKRIKRSHYRTEDLRSQFHMAGIEGRGPELILAPNDFAGVFRDAGIIQPVSSWMDMRRFSPQTVAAITDSDGISYGVPINLGNHLMLFVNKTLRPDIPSSVEEMVKPTSFNQPNRARFDLAFNHLDPYWFVPFMGAFSGGPLREQDGQMRPNLDSQAAVEALRLISMMRLESRIMPEHCDYACAEALFLQGNAAMTINGDWAIGLFEQAHGDALAIAPLPTLQKSGKPMSPMVAGKYVMLRTNLEAPREDLARAFTEYLVSEDVQRFLTERSRRLPSLRALLADPLVLNDPQLSASLAALQHAQPMPMAVELRAVWDAIRPHLQDVTAGRTKPEEAAPRMQRDAEESIKMLAH